MKNNTAWNIITRNTWRFSIALLIGFASHVVSAFTYYTCDGKKQSWFSKAATLDISTTSFPPGSRFELLIQYMMYEWNDVTGSEMMLYVGRDTEGTHAFTNGDNEVYWTDDLPFNTAGRTYFDHTCYWLGGTQYGIKEADIEMNLNRVWSDDGFKGVMLHEIGHAIGLNHTEELAVMNNGPQFSPSSTDNYRALGHTNKVMPFGDDRDGVRFLYPNDDISRNLVAGRFRVVGGTQTPNNFSPQSLPAGGNLSIDYTVQNLGTGYESSVVIYFYLSTNDKITTSDRYLGSAAWNMPSGSSVEAQATVVIPSNVTPGTYRVGYVIDPGGDIPEKVETDNDISLNGIVNIMVP